MTVGSVDQTVEVTATSPLLEVQGTNLGKVLPTKAIRDLPLFIGGGVRSNLAFVILTPGVIGPANNPRIGGGLLDGQSEHLDGAEAQSERRNDPAMNGVSVEGMEEFKVQSSSYSAEFGRTSNGVINWVTKSGTNSLHGSAFVFRYNDDYVITPNVLNHLTIGFNKRHVVEAPGYVSLFPADLARATYVPGTVTPLAPGTSSSYRTSLANWGNSVFTDSRQRTTNIKELVRESRYIVARADCSCPAPALPQ